MVFGFDDKSNLNNQFRTCPERKMSKRPWTRSMSAQGSGAKRRKLTESIELDKLPDLPFMQILSKLDNRDLGRLSQVSKAMNGRIDHLVLKNRKVVFETKILLKLKIMKVQSFSQESKIFKLFRTTKF